MTVLVTGGAGYIGSHAVKLFLARGRGEATVTIDPSRQPPPWVLDVVGDARIILNGRAIYGQTPQVAQKMVEPVRKYLERKR